MSGRGVGASFLAETITRRKPEPDQQTLNGRMSNNRWIEQDHVDAVMEIFGFRHESHDPQLPVQLRAPTSTAITVLLFVREIGRCVLVEVASHNVMALTMIHVEHHVPRTYSLGNSA